MEEFTWRDNYLFKSIYQQSFKWKNNISLVRNFIFSAFVILVFLIPSQVQSQTVIDAFDLPPQRRCTSNDLDVVSANLDLDNCDCEEGEVQYVPIQLGVINNTESFRTSYAFFARLTITNPDNSTDVYYVTGCDADIPPGKDLINPDRTKLISFGADGPNAASLSVFVYDEVNDEYIPATYPGGGELDKIPYVCGSSLQLENIYQAWTDASDNNARQCPLDPSKIAPKCGVEPLLEVGVGLFAGSTKTDVTCNAAADGEIVLTFRGGQGPYYLDFNGAGYDNTPIMSPHTISNLSGSVAGTTYTWKVKDSADPEACEKSGSETLYDPDALNLAITSTGISCNGSNDGIISLDGSATPSNDTFDSYELWKVVGNQDGAGNMESDDLSQGSVSPDGDGNFKTDMAAGTYYIIGTKASANQVSVNCYATSGTETFSDPDALNLAITSTGISCNGSNDGIISLDGSATPSNDTFDSYELWKVVGNQDGAGNMESDDLSQGSVSPDGDGNFKTDMAAGTYYIIGTKASANQVSVNCYATSGTETFSDPDALNLAITSTGISCNGSNDGIISLDGSATPSNDTFDSYELWKVVGNQDGAGNMESDDLSQGSVSPDGDGNFKTDMAAGTYYIIGTKASANQVSVNCYATSGTETFSDPDALNLAITSTGISCNGSNDGIISLDGSATPSNDTFDSYELWKVVGNQDGAGNMESDDLSQGSVSPDGDGNFKTDMAAGTYYIIGTKASANQVSVNCYATSGTETFSDPDALNLAITSTGISCNGSNDGIISLDGSATPSNDTFDSYELWKVVGNQDGAGNMESDDLSQGSVSPDGDGNFKTDMAAGTYYIIGTKASANQVSVNCYATSGTETFSDPDALNLAITSTGISCNGSNDGIISLDGSATPSNDTFDSYELWKVVGNQDGAGNMESDDLSQGSVSPDGDGNFKTDMAAGTYYIIGTKASANQVSVNCYATSGTETFSDPDALNLAITSTGISCNGSNDGIISLDGSATPSNDTFDSYELWKVVGNQDGAGNMESDDLSQGSVSPDGDGNFKTDMAAGTYYIIGTKASANQVSVNCYATSGTETFSDPDALNLAITSTGISCNGSNDGIISLDGSATPSNDTFDSYELWKVVGNQDGAGNMESDDLSQGSVSPDGDGNFKTDMAAGTYYIIGTRASANQVSVNCYATSGTETFSDPDALNLAITSTGISCNGSNDGIISLDGSATPSNDTFDSYELWKVVGNQDGAGNMESDDLSQGSVSPDGDGNFKTDMAAGTYYIIGTRASANQVSVNCYATSGTETFSDPDALNLAITSTGISCNGSNDGIISLDGSATPSNDTFDSYELWKVVGNQDGAGNMESDDLSQGSVSPDGDGNFKTDMAAGTYYIIGTKASANQVSVNCYATSGTETFSDPDALNLAITSTGISCNGSNDGIISLDGSATPSNDTFDSYELWKVVGNQDGAGNMESDDLSQGSVSPDGDGNFKTDMAAGTYYIIGTKASANQVSVNCYATSGTETFSDPTALSLTISPSDETCAGGDGSISLSGMDNSSFTKYTLYLVVGDQDGVGNSETDDIATVVTPNSGVLKTLLSAGSYYVKGEVASANQTSVTCSAFSNLATIDPPFDCNQLFPTQTECSDYLYCDTDKIVQEYMCVTIKKFKGKDQITNVIPGALFYYGDTYITSDLVNKTMNIKLEQTRPDGFNFMLNLNEANVRVYENGCEVSQVDYVGAYESGGKYYVEINVIPEYEGTLVFSVKLDPKTLNGSLPISRDDNDPFFNSFLFGMVVNDNPVGVSYGSLGMNTDRRCEDPVVFERDCVDPASTTLQTESLLKESESSIANIEEPGFSVAPVPFIEQLSIRYEFDYTSDVKIQFFDLNGSLLRTYADKQVTNGDETQINIDFALRSNSVYIMRIETDRDSFSKNIMSGN